MASTPPPNQAFVREVDDELRRDQLIAFWRRWGRWLIVALGVALALFAAFLYWQHRREAAAGVEGEQLTAAFDLLGQGAVGAAGTQLAPIAASSRAGYRAMAVFAQGDILAQKGDARGAAAKFAGLANDASLPPPIRDLALIRQTATEFDALKPAVVVERMRPLAAAGPWQGSAGELLAMTYLAEGRRDLAQPLFAQIAGSDDVPQSIRQRAGQMAGSVDAGARPSSAGPSPAAPKP